MESDTAKGQGGGKHLGGKVLARGVKPGLGRDAIFAGSGQIVLQIDGLRWIGGSSLGGGGQFHREGADSIRLQRGSSAPLATVAGPSGNSWPLISRAAVTGPANATCRFGAGLAAHFDHANNDLAALLGLLHGRHEHVVAVDMQEGKALAQRAGVAGALERNQRER